MGYLDLAMRAAIGIVFAVACTSKLRNRIAFQRFRRSLEVLKLPAPAKPRVIAPVVVAAEVATVVSLAAPFAVAIGFTVALALLLAFVLSIVRALTGGVQVPCQCFGSDGSTLAGRHVVRNVLLVVLSATGLAAQLSGTGSGGASVGGGVVAALAGAALACMFIRWDDIAFLAAGPVEVSTLQGGLD
jgi:uncharacterized membrane protein YphA (DoxX/SURF4 family)